MYRIKVVNEAVVVMDTGPIDDHDHPMTSIEAVSIMHRLMDSFRDNFQNDTPRAVVVQLH